ncbi:MAG: helix-turn-helix domain-containing protein [Rhodopseudomonas sp.]|nr:helix-turn-helix domain-containing protein [Rhodopseudomonas sp.]
MSAIETVSKPGYAPFMRKPTHVSTPRPKAPPHTRERPSAKPRQHPNRIYELTKTRRTTYEAIAEAAGVHRITIAKLANGTSKLTQDWMNVLATILQVRPEELIAAPADTHLRRVKVRGALQAGDWSESHEWSPEEQFEVAIPDEPQLRKLQLYAGKIIGESMNLRFPQGSIVVFSRIGQRPGEIEVGKRYHVRVTRSDGQTEETLKTLVADEHGTYWLKPESSHPAHQNWLPLDNTPGATVELIGRARYVVHRED